MSHVDYFKAQAKKLFKDYKTQTSYIDEVDGHTYFSYSPTYFDIGRIFLEYDWDEENFTLMKAQHLFARMVGFDKWGLLIRASDAELELAKQLWENQEKIHLEEWQMYVARVESDNGIILGSNAKLDIFLQVFAERDGHCSQLGGYRVTSSLNNA